MDDQLLEELAGYAGLLAYIMNPVDDQAEVEENAVHVWRVRLNVEDHTRLQGWLSDEDRADLEADRADDE